MRRIRDNRCRPIPDAADNADDAGYLGLRTSSRGPDGEEVRELVWGALT